MGLLLGCFQFAPRRQWLNVHKIVDSRNTLSQMSRVLLLVLQLTTMPENGVSNSAVVQRAPPSCFFTFNAGMYKF